MLRIEHDVEGQVFASLVPRALSTAPRLAALFGAFAFVAQQLEDSAADVLLSTALDSATGHALDQWAELVGETREGLDDDWLRRFIRAAILVNKCQGTVDELVTIYGALAGGRAYHTHYWVAAYSLVVVRDSWMPDSIARRVARTMARVKPAGVFCNLQEAVAGVVGFESTPSVAPLLTGLLARRLPEDLP